MFGKSLIKAPDGIDNMNWHSKGSRRLIFNFSPVVSLSILIVILAYADTVVAAEKQKLMPDSVNLLTKDFYAAYSSKSAEERKHAELFLLGVMDATEGKSWCDYKTYKTTTIRQMVYISLKKQPDMQAVERAANVIERILSERFPCENGRK